MALAGDHVQVLVDGYDLTGDHNKVMIDDARNMLEAHAFGMSGQRYLASRRQMKLQHEGYLNADSARSHPVLNGVAVDGVVAVLVGVNADPVVGDAVFNFMIQQEMYQTTPEVGQVIPFKANFVPRGGDDGGWGVALAVPVSITDTTSGSAVNNGAASSNGGAAFLHILQAAASDTYTIVVEGSTSGAFAGEETMLGTFTLDASALGSERLAISGTLPQYTRYKATRSGTAGDTVRLAVTLVRF